MYHCFTEKTTMFAEAYVGIVKRKVLEEGDLDNGAFWSHDKDSFHDGVFERLERFAKEMDKDGQYAIIRQFGLTESLGFAELKCGSKKVLDTENVEYLLCYCIMRELIDINEWYDIYDAKRIEEGETSEKEED